MSSAAIPIGKRIMNYFRIEKKQWLIIWFLLLCTSLVQAMSVYTLSLDNVKLGELETMYKGMRSASGVVFLFFFYSIVNTISFYVISFITHIMFIVAGGNTRLSATFRILCFYQLLVFFIGFINIMLLPMLKISFHTYPIWSMWNPLLMIGWLLIGGMFSKRFEIPLWKSMICTLLVQIPILLFTSQMNGLH